MFNLSALFVKTVWENSVSVEAAKTMWQAWVKTRMTLSQNIGWFKYSVKKTVRENFVLSPSSFVSIIKKQWWNASNELIRAILCQL